MIGDGRSELTELTPGLQTWLALTSANFRALNDQHAGRVVSVSGEAFSALAVVALSTDGKCYKADSNDLILFNALGLALSDASGADESVIVQIRGEVSWPSHGFDVGLPLFLSETAGALTSTAPATPRIIGMVLDNDRIWLDCPRSWASL